MSSAHYRLSVALAASFCFALAGCGSSPPAAVAAANPGAPQAANPAPDDDAVDTTGNILTVLGLAKKRPLGRQPGPQTGPNVSPVLWQAAKDTLDFVKLVREDPMAGTMTTDWYSPPGKPNERLKVDVFVMSRALHSDSVAVTVERQVQEPDGTWKDAPIDRRVPDQLDVAILHQARRLRAAWTGQQG